VLDPSRSIVRLTRRARSSGCASIRLADLDAEHLGSGVDATQQGGNACPFCGSPAVGGKADRTRTMLWVVHGVSGAIHDRPPSENSAMAVRLR
jgi:hypothetical protein